MAGKKAAKQEKTEKVSANAIDSIVVHYGELAIKGLNRGFFESRLISNIQKKLGKLADSYAKEEGQIVVRILPSRANDIDKAIEALKCIPGISNFSPAIRCELDFDKIVKLAVEFSKEKMKDKSITTFRADARRHCKTLPFTSNQLNVAVGDAIVKKYKKKVKLENPDLTIKIDLSNKFAYISVDNIQGVGGLPTERRQKVVALLSGGFDSPVAAFMMMRRSCEVILVHFQNKNQETKSVADKIEKLAAQLSKYQVYTKLYIVPFEDLQKEIIMKVNSRIRMLVYRRFMLKIASRIAFAEKARLLVTGDSVSQVSSQTVDNLEATYKDSERPVVTPLIGTNKDEIVSIARQIGTYAISELPYGDCCSFFLPKHPELHVSLGELRKAEEEIESEKLVEKAVKDAKISEF